MGVNYVGYAVTALSGQKEPRFQAPVPFPDVRFIFTNCLYLQFASSVIIVHFPLDLGRNKYDRHWGDFTSPWCNLVLV